MPFPGTIIACCDDVFPPNDSARYLMKLSSLYSSYKEVDTGLALTLSSHWEGLKWASQWWKCSESLCRTRRMERIRRALIRLSGTARSAIYKRKPVLEAAKWKPAR